MTLTLSFMVMVLWCYLRVNTDTVLACSIERVVFVVKGLGGDCGSLAVLLKSPKGSSSTRATLAVLLFA